MKIALIALKLNLKIYLVLGLGEELVKTNLALNLNLKIYLVLGLRVEITEKINILIYNNYILINILSINNMIIYIYIYNI